MRKNIALSDVELLHKLFAPDQFNLLFLFVSIGLLTVCTELSFGQAVSINSTGNAPDAESILDIESTTKGILLPRMTVVQRDAISPSADDHGMMIYNLTDSQYNYWDGSSWQTVGSGAVNFLDDAYDGGESGVGRTITADAGAVNIQGAGGLLVNGMTGIGTSSPDASSILDVSSNSQGFLMPRLSTVERDAITLPATGLMIYNHTLNDGQLNIGTPSAPIWEGINGPYADPLINSVTEGGDISTAATSNLLVPGMTLSPVSGSYMVLFNAQMTSSQTFSSDQGVIDVNGIYNDLMNEPGGVAHGLVFGSSEVLTPGVYDVTGAASIAGTLTLDGEGDSDAIFIIRATGAFTTGVGTIVNLIGGASSNNIFWVSEGAMSTGDPTTMYGTLVSHGAAVSLGANTDLEGRMFTTTGAITMGANSTLTAPTGASYIDLGVLSAFVMFTPSGAISGCATCAVTGDVGTAAGVTSAFDGIVGTVYAPGTEPTATTTTYSIYQNGLEVVNSSRLIKLNQSTVTLQATVTVTSGDTIEIRWKVDAGEAILNHRTLSMVRSGS
jgi:hypothetical protein